MNWQEGLVINVNTKDIPNTERHFSRQHTSVFSLAKNLDHISLTHFDSMYKA
jgi:hypothetical protein